MISVVFIFNNRLSGCLNLTQGIFLSKPITEKTGSWNKDSYTSSELALAVR
jgi:hypothetical protein